MNNNQSLSDFTNSYVEIRPNNHRILVGDVETGGYLSLSDFVASMSNRFYDDSFDQLDRRDDLTVTNRTEITKIWRKSPARIRANDLTYQPCLSQDIKGNRLIKMGNKLLFNTYSAPVFKFVNDSGYIEVFLSFLNDLFGDDSSWVLGWLSQIIQAPNRSPKVAPLFIYINDSGDLQFLIHKLISPLIGASNIRSYLNLRDLKLSLRKYHFDSLLTTMNVNGSEPTSRIKNLSDMIVGNTMRQKKQLGLVQPYCRYILMSYHKEETISFESLSCVRRINVKLCKGTLASKSELESIKNKSALFSELYSFLYRVSAKNRF